MSKFIIQGGTVLKGEVVVQGSKNDVLPALAATLLTSEPCLLRNVPRISDVAHMLEILKSLGAEYSWEGEHEVRVSCKNVATGKLDKKLVASMRSSVLLMGPLLARFGSVTLPEPGGDVIGKRPLDTHLYAFERMGAKIEYDNNQYELSSNGLKPATIILPELSVTATENVVMAAALIPGETVIKLAAAEPHVQNVCRMLVKMGAQIDGIGSHTLTVHGKKELRGVDHAIIPDTLEVGTFLVAIVATKGEAFIKNVVPEHLEMVLNLVQDIGIHTELKKGGLHIRAPKKLKPFRLLTLPYPGFPTDLQAPFSVLATQADGMSMIHDPLYEGRLAYVPWLVKMGANAVVCDPHRVVFSGPTPLHGYEIRALDIRAGATLVIAGLAASGTTVVHDAEILDRGYEKLAERLGAMGARISRE